MELAWPLRETRREGILILAPVVSYGRSRKNEIATDIETDNAADERKPEQQLYGFRAVYVFDISQIEGKDLPALTEVKGDVSGHRVTDQSTKAV